MSGQAVVTIAGKTWTCQVASTPAELSTGLSNIPGLAPYTGMLFILGADYTTLHIDMSQMLFALDILFISGDGAIVGAWKDVAPGLSFETTMPAPGARYFLEVNAGETEALGIGDTAHIQIITLPEPPGQSTDWISPLVSFASVIIMGATLVKMGKTMSDAMFGKPGERPIRYSFGGKSLLPQTGSRKPTRNDVEIGTWAERDRMGIWITDKRTGKSVAEWWDEDAQEMFEQGWFKPGDIRHQTITGRAFEESVLDYAEHTGILKEKESTGRSSPAVVSTKTRPLPAKPGKLEFLPDSMEFLAYTIDDIGYREKIDTAFREAIARAKRR